MRLIDTTAFDIETRAGLRLIEVGAEEEPVPYAILSHRWGHEEVLLKDVASTESPSTLSSKKGYAKLAGAITQAKADGYDYLWVDTCCIDKSSSAELSEAINSMFEWYRCAEVCYVYLQDVQSSAELGLSNWFERGWTLQELLAPKNVRFYSANWSFLGSKQNLAQKVSSITGIQIEILRGTSNLEDQSISRRMSWVATRRTSRPEDIAYCLLGIFSVNMPLLYGEGSRAFIRLQEEILRSSDDYTLFAWQYNNDGHPPIDERNAGLLAPSPAGFRLSGDYQTYRDWDAPPFAMTNKGLQITLDVRWADEQIVDGVSVTLADALLPCTGTDDLGFLVIPVEVDMTGSTRFASRRRIERDGMLEATAHRGRPTQLYFPQKRLRKLDNPSIFYNWRFHLGGKMLLRQYPYVLRHAQINQHRRNSVRPDARPIMAESDIRDLNCGKCSPLLQTPKWELDIDVILFFESKPDKTRCLPSRIVVFFGMRWDGVLGFNAWHATPFDYVEGEHTFVLRMGRTHDIPPDGRRVSKLPISDMSATPVTLHWPEVYPARNLKDEFCFMSAMIEPYHNEMFKVKVIHQVKVSVALEPYAGRHERLLRLEMDVAAVKPTPIVGKSLMLDEIEHARKEYIRILEDAFTRVSSRRVKA